MLAVPKPSRMLIEEKQVSGADMSIPEGGKASSLSRASRDGSPSPNHASSSASITTVPGKNVKTKASFKRLSDVLPNGAGGTRPGVGGKNDLWLVRFNDVVLRCQRTGTTTLPLATGLASASNSRSNSLTEFAGGAKAKYATTGRRHSQLKPRNLYKFVKVRSYLVLVECDSLSHLLNRSRHGLSVTSLNLELEWSLWKSMCHMWQCGLAQC